MLLQEQLRLKDQQVTALSHRLAHTESDGPKARLMAAAAAASVSSSRHQVRTSSSSGMGNSSHTPLRPGSAGAGAAAAAASTVLLGSALSEQDVLELRKELQQQEQLIQGYQQENEAATSRIKVGAIGFLSYGSVKKQELIPSGTMGRKQLDLFSNEENLQDLSGVVSRLGAGVAAVPAALKWFHSFS